MALYTHTIRISENTFQRLRLQAKANQTTINEFADQAIKRSLSPSLQHVPEKWQIDLQQMQSMSDEMLWRIARSALPTKRIELYDMLLATKEQRTLSPSENEQLEILHEESDMLMIRKSYACALLKSRGFKIPDPYTAEAYE